MNFRMVADVRSMSNYYPYGMEIEAGSWSGGDYNYGYNGMLKEGIGKDIYNTHFRNLSVGDFVGWWSPDPLEVKFPNVSPYLSMGGNPILFVDFNGDETTLHGDEDDSYRFVDKQNKISDAVHFNLDENNNMQYDVIVPFRYSEADKTLMDAIDDKEINNHIIITDLYRAERVDGSKKFISTGGLFAGSFIGKDKKIHSIQYYNPILANKISEFFKETIKNGEIETHEGLEVYIGAKIFQNSTKILSVDELFDASHNATLEIFHSEDLYFKGIMDKYDMIYPILFYKDMRIEDGFVPYRIHKKDVKTSTYKDYKIE